MKTPVDSECIKLFLLHSRGFQITRVPLAGKCTSVKSLFVPGDNRV